MCETGRERSGALLAVATLILGAPLPSAAQEEVEALAVACAAGVTAQEAPCLEAALAAQGLGASVGLAAAGGAEVPGSASTLGLRLRRHPRIAFFLRAGTGGGATSVRGGNGFQVPVVQGGVVVGVFDGFSPLPTVGGLLSVDLMGTAGRLFLPGDRGFNDGVNVFGYGARVGLLRESFTLPGLTASVVRRHGGTVDVRGPDAEPARIASGETTVTSLRATLGKDLLAVGLHGGGGWDRYRVEGRMGVGRGSLSEAPLDESVRIDGLTSERTLLYGGVSRTFLVVQVAAEVGWATGLEDAPAAWEGSYDPARGRFFGSLSGRLTF